jgi:hypothetical protein
MDYAEICHFPVVLFFKNRVLKGQIFGFQPITSVSFYLLIAMLYDLILMQEKLEVHKTHPFAKQSSLTY